MHKISLFAGLVATVIGLGAVSTAGSAFAAGCLTSQEALPQLSLSHDSMVPGAGFGYDKDNYAAALAKGNNCATTPQSTSASAPTADFGTASKARVSHN